MKYRLAITALVAAFILPTSVNAQRLMPKADFPGVVHQVQSADSYRVNELENEVRRLNGKVEELNFLLLQLQEKFRKLEEDSEIRFQEIEEKQSGVTDSSTSVAKAENSGEASLGKPETSEANKASDENQTVATQKPPKRGLEPRALGTLTFDKDGNVVDTRPRDERIANTGLEIFSDGVNGSVEASEFGATPEEVFNAGKKAYDARDFTRAQQAFTAQVKAWPKEPKNDIAQYYLGKAFFWQKAYYKAADVHLETHNAYPEALTAPDNLLALGLALAGLNQREVACATYAEVLKQYPESEPKLGNQIKDEQAAAKC